MQARIYTPKPTHTHTHIYIYTRIHTQTFTEHTAARERVLWIGGISTLCEVFKCDCVNNNNYGLEKISQAVQCFKNIALFLAHWFQPFR